MILSVDLSAEWVHMLQVRPGRRSLEIVGFACIPTPEGCLQNGIVTNATVLGAALRRMAEENGFKAKKLRFAVTSPTVSFHELTVPAVGARDLGRLLREEANHLTSAKKESLMDYVLLDRLEKDGKAFYRVWCAIVPRSLVEGYRDAALKGGFVPERFDVAANAAYKAYRLDERLAGEGTVVFAGVRGDEVCLSMFEGDSGRFYNYAPIVAAKKTVENEFVLSSRVAEIAPTAESQEERMLRTATGQLSKLAQFQMMKNKEKPVTRIFLCSDKAQDRALANTVAEMLRLPAAPAEAPAQLKCPEGFVYSEYLYAVGAAIGI